MDLKGVLNSKKEGIIYECDLGFYVKKYRGYLLRLTYNEGWKYCSIHEHYTKAKYKPLSKGSANKLMSEYVYVKDDGYDSKFLCSEANTEFSV